jgi:hypothetical protein
LLACCHPDGARGPSASDEAVLIALQAEGVRAADAHDAATLRKLIADDWVISFQTEPGGPFKLSNKAKAIAKWTQIEPNVETKPTVITGAHARIDADTDTGIVWARITDHWHDKDGDHEVKTDVTDIFAVRDGRWVWIASSESLVAP